MPEEGGTRQSTWERIKDIPMTGQGKDQNPSAKGGKGYRKSDSGGPTGKERFGFKNLQRTPEDLTQHQGKQDQGNGRVTELCGVFKRGMSSSRSRRGLVQKGGKKTPLQGTQKKREGGT